jgi:ketosteroid isomerase-like protein
MARPAATVVLLALIGASIGGCIFTTDHDTPVDDPGPLRSSPDSLIAQLQWAYNNMDLDAYLDCFADSLVFYLSEEEVAEHPELQPGYWGKAVEDSIHAHMFGDGAMSASGIDLTLTTTAIDTVSVPDGRGRGVGWQYREAVDLRLHVGGNWMYWATAPSIFIIRQDPDDVGPRGETLYEVWEWREVDHAMRGGGRTEQSSWGAIKAMYRPAEDWGVRDTPQHVLDNLVRAYRNKDVEHYLDCFAPDFIFFLNPDEVEQHPELEPGYWGKAEERTIHERMFGNGQVHADRITLTLSQVGDPIPIEPTPGEIHWQYKEAVDLSVYVGYTQYWATAPAMFEFRIDQDQVGPNGESLWEIISWYDLEPLQRSGSRVEPASWGAIKALYL